MSIGLNERPNTEVSEVEAVEKTQKKPKQKKKSRLPQKRTMNLYYKPDRTTKPATIALYTLFVLVCLLGLSKFLVYDIWMETRQAEETLAATEMKLTDIMLELKNYSEIRERYQRYAATDEERVLIDRMDVLALLDHAVGATASMQTISIGGDTVQLQFSGVTLAQTAQIVRVLEASPIVASTVVNTASTTEEEGIPNDESGLVQANVLIHLQGAINVEV